MDNKDLFAPPTEQELQDDLFAPPNENEVEERKPQAEEPSMSNLDVAGLAALQSLSFGGADELKAALEAPFSDKTYEQLRDEERALYKKAQESNPALYGTVDIGAGVIPAIVSGGTSLIGSGIRAAKAAPSVFKAAKAAAPSMVKLAGIGAAQGAAQGLGSSEAETSPELAQDVLTGLGLGAGLGAGLGVATPALARAGQKAANTIDTFTDYVPTGKIFKRARELTKEGKKFTGDAQRERLLKESNKLAKNIQDSIVSGKETAGKGIGKILKRSEDKIDISNELNRIQKAVENTDPSTTEGKAALKELQGVLDNFKQMKTSIVKPKTLVKTGEEKALEKLAKKQAKMSEEAALMNEPINFTEPEVTEQFVKSVETRQGKPMVEPITSGEFNPVEIVQSPEMVANLNARELQTLRQQISDIQAKSDIGGIASKRLAQAKKIVDDTLNQKVLSPDLSNRMQQLNKQFGASKDAAKLIDENLINAINPVEEKTALNTLAEFLRKPTAGRSGDVYKAKKQVFFDALKEANPNADVAELSKKADDLSELYEMNLMGESIFGGVSLRDPSTLLGTGRAVSMRAGQATGAIEKGLGKAAEAAQLDRTLARNLSKKAPEPLKDILKQYDQARLKNMAVGATMRKPVESRVESRNEARQEFMTQGIDSLNKSTTADLEAFSNAIAMSGKPGADKYANTLKKMASTDPKNRNALSFGLMSDPNFRELYKEQMSPFGVEENEE